jgi:demethylmenaquinone methyltransferase/2-methoxy-6-polyprenyl-1,4-benzoquinol methylase
MLDRVMGWHGLGRYTLGARLYDVLSLERPVYRVGRLAGIDLLRLQPGDRVLDVGCGTGLNFAALDAAIGPTGTIVGVDLSAHMLARAHARVRRHGWHNVGLVQADAGSRELAGLLGDGPYDAVLATFALSVVGDGRAAWRSALAAARPGGRIAVVDLALPAGWWAVLAPLARLACFTGGVDLHREPWRWVTRDTTDVEQRSLRAGHIRVSAGTVPDSPGKQ